jgi:hypothetical protein
MEQSSSWKSNRYLTSKELPRILWKPKVYYRIYKCPSPVLILNHIVPDHVLTSKFMKFHLNCILPSKSGFSKWSLFVRFSHQNTLYNSTLPQRSISPAHSFFSIWSTERIWVSSQIIKLPVMSFPSFQPWVLPLRPNYSPQHHILRHPQPTFLPQFQRPNFTPIQNNRKNFISLKLHL